MGAQVLLGDWTVYTQIMSVAVVFCLVAVMALTVPLLFDYWHRWRENRRMYTQIQTSRKPTTPVGTTPQAKQPAIAKNAGQHALGWSAENETNGSGDLRAQPGAKPGTVLGREKTILIADDDPVVVQSLARRLQQMGFTVFRSPDAAHALMGVIKMQPDLVILDVNMPAGNGLAVCEMMACDKQCANIPVIVHSVFADEAVKRRCRQLGAHHVEKSPKSWTEIKSLVEALIGEKKTVQPQPAAPPSQAASIPPVRECSQVLCIESPKDRLESVDRQLSAHGMNVVRVSDLEEGYWTCFTERPHAIIIQIAEDRKEMLRLLSRLAEHPVTRTLPVLLIDEGDAIANDELPPSGNVKIVKYPLDWDELLGELNKLLPVFKQKAAAPLPSVAQPNPATSGTNDQLVDAKDQPSEAAAEKKPLKVLCIDDDPVVARSVAIRLQPYGIEVKGANSGTQGYLMAVTEQPDLILLDLNMPDGDGHYVLLKLQDNEHTKEIPIIILTVESHPGVQRQMLSVGATAYVTKPVNWPELFAEMERCIQLPDQLVADYKLTSQLTLSQP